MKTNFARNLFFGTVSVMLAVALFAVAESLTNASIANAKDTKSKGSRAFLDEKVPDVKNFKLLYSFDPLNVKPSDGVTFTYDVDNSKDIKGKIKRVCYFLRYKKDGKDQYAAVVMPPLDPDPAKLGVPVTSVDKIYQQTISKVKIYSNVEGVETGEFKDGCNVEFWSGNTTKHNVANVPDAGSSYDWGDGPRAGVGYGSMQIHNYSKKQCVISFSNFRGTDHCDVGIGNSPSGHPDWTFSASAKTFADGQFLILVELD
ncbi:MAG: hypothetical protein LBT09_05580 [Planctomycetaceae bacterium]|jgi:hypothetical protein|nr:hypothetical protein [Planctomycetaceae bacterium]